MLWFMLPRAGCARVLASVGARGGAPACANLLQSRPKEVDTGPQEAPKSPNRRGPEKAPKMPKRGPEASMREKRTMPRMAKVWEGVAFTGTIFQATSDLEVARRVRAVWPRRRHIRPR